MSERADMAWNLLILATQHDDEIRREAMRKLVRAYGDARFQQGRAKESEVLAERETDRLAQEFERRRHLREVTS